MLYFLDTADFAGEGNILNNGAEPLVRTPEELSLRLKALRKARGWSQVQLGHRLSISQERVSVIENHPERIGVDLLMTVLKSLGAQLAIHERSAINKKK